MINDELQYRVKNGALKRFRETLKNHGKLTADYEPWARKLHRAQIEGEIKQLEVEIKVYERAKSRKT